MGPALDANYRACAADAQSYEALGLSRDAARERKEAKRAKRGRADPRHEGVKRIEREEKVKAKAARKAARTLRAP